MREQDNILKYGFLLFLIAVGIVSIFYQDRKFANAINGLSVPIFMLSLSVMFVKANQYGREEVLKRISNQEKTCNDLSTEISKKSKQIEKNESEENRDIVEKVEINKEINLLYKKSLISTETYKFMCRYFSIVDFFTKVCNTFAMISFAWCLLSLMGIFVLKSSYLWVNVFSLAIVFFDFFILDDVLAKSVRRKIERFQNQAVDKITLGEANEI